MTFSVKGSTKHLPTPGTVPEPLEPTENKPSKHQRHINVGSTSLRRHDVAATSKRRYFYVVCLL